MLSSKAFIEIFLSNTFDGKRATVVNGSTIDFAAKSELFLKLFHGLVMQYDVVLTRVLLVPDKGSLTRILCRYEGFRSKQDLSYNKSD